MGKLADKPVTPIYLKSSMEREKARSEGDERKEKHFMNIYNK